MFKTIKSQLSTIIELLAEIEQNTRWLLEERRDWPKPNKTKKFRKS